MGSNLEVFDINKNYSSPKKRKRKSNKRNKNKIVFYLISLLILFGLIFYLYKYTDHFNFLKQNKNSQVNDQISSEKEIEIILQEVKYELGAKLKYDKDLYVVTDLNLDDIEIDLSQVSVDISGKTDKIGEYSYKVTYKDKEYTNKIIVEDNTPPIVILKTVYIAKGEKVTGPEMFFRNVVDNSNSYVANIIDSEKINTQILGEKEINILVKDINENEITVKAKLVVLDETYKDTLNMNDLNISYNDKNDLDWDGTITEKFITAVITHSTHYTDAVQKANRYDWKTKMKSINPNAVIEKEEILTLYNQHDLVVGIVKKITVKENEISKSYYLKY